MFKINDLPFRRKSWVTIANVPKARVGWELSDCVDVKPEHMKTVHAWIKRVSEGKVIRAEGNKLCGKGLLLVGKPGHGKTTLSLAIIQEIIRTFDLDVFDVAEGKTLVKPCHFSTYNDIMVLKGREISGEQTDEEHRLFLGMHGTSEDDAYNIRVLVVDDVGKEHVTSSGWNQTMLHQLLRTRYNHGLPTIVTTNLPVSAWAAAYGEATESFINEAFVTLILESNEGDLRKRP
jgi:DNA replication protein DnaC